MTAANAVDESVQPNPALRVVVLYKLLRGLSLLAALVIALLVARGGASSLQTLAHPLHEHWTTGVSGRIAAWLLEVLDVRHAWLAVTGLALDGYWLVLQRGTNT